MSACNCAEVNASHAGTGFTVACDKCLPPLTRCKCCDGHTEACRLRSLLVEARDALRDVEAALKAGGVALTPRLPTLLARIDSEVGRE